MLKSCVVGSVSHGSDQDGYGFRGVKAAGVPTKVTARNQSVGPRTRKMRPREKKRSVTATVDRAAITTVYANRCVPRFDHSMRGFQTAAASPSELTGALFCLMSRMDEI